MTGRDILEGRRILVVEDNYFLAENIAQQLRRRGAAVIGPIGTVDEALDLLNKVGSLDGAIVDLDLRGEMAYPVADALIASGVPLVFATAYKEISIPARYLGVPRCGKLFDAEDVVRALLG